MSRVRQLLSVVRLRPFDTDSEAGRAAERHRLVALAWLTSVGGRGVNFIVTLITVPLTKTYLGDERYGLWMVISSVMAMLTFADLGMGNGLMNAVAAAHGRDDRSAAARVVSSALILLTAIASGLMLAFLIAYPFISWTRVFNIKSALAAHEAGWAVLVYVFFFLANLVLSAIPRIQAGYQEGYIAGIWQSIGSACALLAVLGVIKLQLGLAWLVAAMSGAPVIVTFASAVVLFAIQRPWLRPRWSLYSTAAAKIVLGTGFLFLVIQISASLAFFSDNVIAEHMFGNEAVTLYAIVFRLFMMPTMFASIAFAPMWPAYTEAISRNDWRWVRRTFYRTTALAALVSLPTAALMLIFHQKLLFWWGVGDLKPSISLAAGMACWLFLFIANTPVSMFFNGLNIVKFQSITASLMAVANLGLSIALAKAIGLSGIIWGTVIAYTMFEAIPRLLWLPRIVRNLEHQPAAMHVPSENVAPATI